MKEFKEVEISLKEFLLNESENRYKRDYNILRENLKSLISDFSIKEITKQYLINICLDSNKPRSQINRLIVNCLKNADVNIDYNSIPIRERYKKIQSNGMLTYGFKELHFDRIVI